MQSTRYCVLIAALVAACGCAFGQDQAQVRDLGLLPGDAAVLPATNSQTDNAAATGNGVTLLVWTDYRARSGASQTVQSDGDIYGVRVNAQGQQLDAMPFLIAGGMGLQQSPLVAWNGEAWLVVYRSQDPVGGYFEMQTRARRVSAEGEVLDPTPLVLGNALLGFSIAGSGGQWLVTSEIYHADNYGTYLAGQRISGAGQLIDATPLMLVDWVYGQAKALAVDGGYVVAGPDWNDSTIVRARRIGTNLQPVGAAFTVPSTNLASNGSQLYVTWVRDFINMVGSPMSLAGVRTVPNGVVLFSDPSIAYYSINAAHDGSNWWFEWGAGSDYRTMRINSAGQVLDPGGVLAPIVIDGTVSTAYNLTMQPRAGGGVSLFWNDSRASTGYDTSVYSLGISGANVPDSQRCQSLGTTSQRSPHLCGGPAGTVATSFVSEAANDDRVLVHLLDAHGASTTVEPIEVHRGATIGNAAIAWDGAEYLVVWEEGASGLTPTTVKARRMSADGSFIDASPFTVMAGFNPTVDALDGRFLVTCANYGFTFKFINLHGMRIDGATGGLLDGATGLLLGGGYYSGQSRVRNDGSRWMVGAHSMWSHNSSQGDAVLAFVPYSGPAPQAFNPTPFSGGTGDLDIAFSGEVYLLAWRSNTLASANNSISGRFMNPDGTYRGGAFTIAEAAGRQLRPIVAWDGANFVVAWEDQRGQASFFDARTDIYGVRISEAGQVLDAPAFVISAVPDGDDSSAIFARDGYTLIATPRFTSDASHDSYRVGLASVGAPPCPADFDHSGGVDGDDTILFFAAWDSNDPLADFNRDGGVDGDDVIAFFGAWDAGC